MTAHIANNVREQIVVVLLLSVHKPRFSRFNAALSIMDAGDFGEQPVLVVQDRRIVSKKALCNLGLLFADSARHNLIGFSADVSANCRVKMVVVILRDRIVNHCPFSSVDSFLAALALARRARSCPLPASSRIDVPHLRCRAHLSQLLVSISPVPRSVLRLFWIKY